jgi:hypothetical protein
VVVPSGTFHPAPARATPCAHSAVTHNHHSEYTHPSSKMELHAARTHGGPHAASACAFRRLGGPATLPARSRPPALSTPALSLPRALRSAGGEAGGADHLAANSSARSRERAREVVRSGVSLEARAGGRGTCKRRVCAGGGVIARPWADTGSGAPGTGQEGISLSPMRVFGQTAAPIYHTQPYPGATAPPTGYREHCNNIRNMAVSGRPPTYTNFGWDFHLL